MRLILLCLNFVVVVPVALAISANASMKAFIECLGEDVHKYHIIRNENHVEIYPREVRDLDKYGLDRKINPCIKILIKLKFSTILSGGQPDVEIISSSDSEEEYVSITSGTHGVWKLSNEGAISEKSGIFLKKGNMKNLLRNPSPSQTFAVIWWIVTTCTQILHFKDFRINWVHLARTGLSQR